MSEDKEETTPETKKDASENQTSARVLNFPRYSDTSTEQANLAAHLFYTQGKSFYQTMLDAGYSVQTARNGPKVNFEQSPGLKQAFIAASEKLFTPETIKKNAIHRLALGVMNPENDYYHRDIETLGRFKEFDWFVKSQDTQIGVLIDLDVSPDKTAENPVKTGEFEDK